MLLDSIIDMERNRMERKGYGTIVMPEEMTISSCLRTFALHNSVYILTGVRGSSDDIVDGNRRIGLYSPSGGILMSARNIATLGTSVFWTFRGYLTVSSRAMDKGFAESATGRWNSFDLDNSETVVPSFSLEFVKIIPTKLSLT